MCLDDKRRLFVLEDTHTHVEKKDTKNQEDLTKIKVICSEREKCVLCTGESSSAFGQQRNTWDSTDKH
jgi:hypothetical protein